jgi:hypothetical protein
MTDFRAAPREPAPMLSSYGFSDFYSSATFQCDGITKEVSLPNRLVRIQISDPEYPAYIHKPVSTREELEFIGRLKQAVTERYLLCLLL